MPFDLAEVRVHEGSGADNAARRAGTLAYAAGRDIVLSDRARGDEAVLAHEIAHVAQQRAAPAGPSVPRVRDAALERDASVGAGRLLRAQPLGPAVPAPVGAHGLDAGRGEYYPGNLEALKQLLEGQRLWEAGHTSLAVSILRDLSDTELQAIARDWDGDLSLTLARALTAAEWAEIEPRLGPYVSVEAELAAGPHEAPTERAPEAAPSEGVVAPRYEVDGYLAQGMADLDPAQALAQASGRFTLIVEREDQYDVALLRMPAEVVPGNLAQIVARPEANVIHPPGTYPVMLVTADAWRWYYRSASERGEDSLEGRWYVDLRGPGPTVLPGLGRAALVAHDPQRVLDIGLREFVLKRLAAAEAGAQETQARIGGGLEGVSIEELDTIRLTAATLAVLGRQISATRAMANQRIPEAYEPGIEGDLEKVRWLAEQKRLAGARLPGLLEAEAATLTQYPMLARINDLDAFTAKEDEQQLADLAATIPSVLASIIDLRTRLATGSLDLWDYPKIVEAGLDAMGIEDQGLRDAAMARCQREVHKEQAADVGIMLLALVLGLGAAFASPGLALAFAGAALVVDTADALRQTARADLQLALANSNLDPTEALVPGDLTGRGATVWLAWAGVVMDTVQLFQVARLFQQGLSLAEETRLIRLVAEAEGLDPGDLTRLLEQATTTFETADDQALKGLALLLGVPVEFRQGLPRGVWVTFNTDALGGVRGIRVVLGAGATEADLLGHVATVERLQQWVGAAGWVRTAWAWARGQARAGQLRFEALLELEKLDAMVHVRRVLLENQPLEPGAAGALEREIQVLTRQRNLFAKLVEETRASRGVVAASFDDEEPYEALGKMLDDALARQGEPRAGAAPRVPEGAGEAPAPFNEAELGRTFGRMFEEAIEPELLDWGAYSYADRTLGIVDTPQGPQAWYIRTGKGGAALAGEPAKGNPARIHGFAHLHELDAAGREITGRFRKWFMKPRSGRMGEGNEAVYAWLQERAAALRAPSPLTTKVARTRPADTSDLKQLNDWLRSRGITPGEGEYHVGDLIYVLDETEYRSLPTAPAFLEIGDKRVPLFVEEGGLIWRMVPCRIVAIP